MHNIVLHSSVTKTGKVWVVCRFQIIRLTTHNNTFTSSTLGSLQVHNKLFQGRDVNWDCEKVQNSIMIYVHPWFSQTCTTVVSSVEHKGRYFRVQTTSDLIDKRRLSKSSYCFGTTKVSKWWQKCNLSTELSL